MEYNEKYMARALEIAAWGKGYTSPNPMVGAVIVHNDRIISEGYHRRCGEAHAEVNAVNSVADPSLLTDCTMYVTLEPCSHYGKTPPCAKLIIDRRIPRVVVGATDPFVKVAGRGIRMLREAGVDVVTGVMAEASIALNKRFFTAHTQGRPYITLKWAQSRDGYMDHTRQPGEPAARFSTPLSIVEVHRLRALHDAILTTAATVNADDPLLNVREWNGRNPQPVIIDRCNLINAESKLLTRNPIIYNKNFNLAEILTDLYRIHGITSLLVEAGPTILESFIESGLWDAARVETSARYLGEKGIKRAPMITRIPDQTTFLGPNRIDMYSNPHYTN